jgi:L-ascorbate metabolism protein UlaG (beta-lactamase superfamily)
MLVESEGLRILTDPVLFDRVGPLTRVTTTLEKAHYSGIDVALVSHLHLDHFDLRSLRVLGPDVELVVPSGAADLARSEGFRRVVELGPGDRHVVGSVSLTATPAVHGGFRPPFGPRAAAVGYLIEAGEFRTYFAGDTDVWAGMAELGPELDVALLPVWGWGPRLGPGHLDPARAVTALHLLRPRFVIPIHWGTLWPFGLGRVRSGRLTDPPLEFAARVAATDNPAAVLLTPPGEPVALVP